MTGCASSKTDFTALGMYVDRKRILAHLTFSAVARLCDIATDDVRRVINGSPVGPDAVQALCDWLERSPSFFDTHSLTAKREAYP
ncbi:hypothetical protein FHS76_003489 [Ochrobactrum daejeonense]|uniref:XRE family transcriptional regulator n=1 Tax=Brucella daejeonensis TaxID=659015 RepID=A0A7W9AZY8_9HYPH|nr:hypothetical protein [Brucella daejeonensis]MBB5703582.1 hypothetical protein [Brucella daejeonensis]